MFKQLDSLLKLVEIHCGIMEAAVLQTRWRLKVSSNLFEIFPTFGGLFLGVIYQNVNNSLRKFSHHANMSDTIFFHIWTSFSFSFFFYLKFSLLCCKEVRENDKEPTLYRGRRASEIFSSFKHSQWRAFSKSPCK